MDKADKAECETSRRPAELAPNPDSPVRPAATSDREIEKGAITKPHKRRLCHWREPEEQQFDLDKQAEFQKPEDEYRYERAQAEYCFEQQLDSVLEVKGKRESIWQLSSLECFVSNYLSHALSAHGDLLLRQGLPAEEAKNQFDAHASALLEQTFERKWLFGLRSLGLDGLELSPEQFWVPQRSARDEVRHDFERLIYLQELERLYPDLQPAGADAPRKRGRPAKIDIATKETALALRAAGRSWKEIAKVLNKTPYPSDQQVKNAPNILNHYQKSTSPSPNKS